MESKRESLSIVLPADHNPLVLQQRLDTWRASWQRETSFQRGSSEYNVILTYAQERARAQQDIVQMLYRELDQPARSADAIEISVLQALEGFASNSGTRALLPKTTLDLFRTLGQWLPMGLPPPPRREEGDDA